MTRSKKDATILESTATISQLDSFESIITNNFNELSETVKKLSENTYNNTSKIYTNTYNIETLVEAMKLNKLNVEKSLKAHNDELKAHNDEMMRLKIIIAMLFIVDVLLVLKIRGVF